jgi:hypothetical protein
MRTTALPPLGRDLLEECRKGTLRLFGISGYFPADEKSRRLLSPVLSGDPASGRSPAQRKELEKPKGLLKCDA